MKKRTAILIFLSTILIISSFSALAFAGKKTKYKKSWKKVWEAILDLQEQLLNLGDDQDYVYHLRFLEENEHSAGLSEELLVATFTVIPSNPSNNAILDYYVYCETKVEPEEPSAWSMLAILILDENGELYASVSWIGFGPFHPGNPPDYFWTRMIVPSEFDRWRAMHLPVPNQSSYTFEIYLLGNGGLAYIRNLNLIVEMMDGLPPTS